MIDTTTDFIALVHTLGPQLKEHSDRHDEQSLFVEGNYELLKTNGFMTAQIPESLGGAGVSHSTMCNVVEALALYCPSTALAFSMHQHLLSTMIWKYNQTGDGEDFLRKVATDNLVLISTGAKDWLDSNGTMTKTKGGYLVSGRKFFASQSVYGDVAVTSAQFESPEEGAKVLHFGVPMVSKGVTLLDDWDTLGMRGTGSQTIVFDEVFVPDSAISLERPQGEFHPFWNVVLSVAMPLIMSAYVGIARKAFDLTRSQLIKDVTQKSYADQQLGELYNQLTKARVLHKDMIRLANDLNIKPTDNLSMEILTRKSLVAQACMDTVNHAMSAMGGKAYYKKSGLEKLFRDVQAARYHPLAEKEQQLFTGSYLLRSDAIY